MPQPMSPYYWYMMQQQLGQNMPPPDIPPAGGGDEPTTAPFGPPGQGGPGSFPSTPGQTPLTYGQYYSGSPFIPQGVTFQSPTSANDQVPLPSATPETPSQWGETTNFVPMTSGETPSTVATGAGSPYTYNDPYGTAEPGSFSWYPMGDGTYGQFDQNGNLVSTLPATNIPYGGTQATTQMMSPVQASSGMMGFPPATAAGGVDLGGWGQPAGYFGVPGQGAIGAFGVGGGGGTLAGGSNIGAGPLPGTPSEFGGGIVLPLGSTMGGIAGLHSPGFQQALASGMVLPGWQSGGTTAGDYTGRGVKGAA